MKPHHLYPLLLAACLTLSSCSLFTSKKPEEKKEDKPAFDPNAPPTEEPSVDDIAMGRQGPLGKQNLTVSTPDELAKIDNQADGPVYFTDPDNPDAEIEGITEAFEGAREREKWVGKLSTGMRLARQSNLPTLLWFHDSMLSPRSKSMARELFDTPEFLAWMKGRVIGIRLDSSEGFDADGYKTSSEAAGQSVVTLRRRYGIKKLPAFIVISAEGKIVSKIDASDGFLSAANKGIREAVEQAHKLHQHHLNTLREKGYRDWTNARGTMTIFAKLRKFDRNKDIVYLIEHTGRRRKVKLFDFSAKDIEYLDGLKSGKKKS